MTKELKDIPFITGFSAQQALQQTFQTVESAKKALSDSRDVYMSVAQAPHGMDIYAQGLLRGRIWEIEQMFGVRGVFLSAAGQDQFIYETFFRDKKDGVYVEIGGYDGWRGSNCYFFEKTLGWKGVIAEASPTWIQEIGKHRNADIVHAAVADKDGQAEFMDVISGATQMGGLCGQYIDARLDDVRHYPGHRERKVTVPVLTLASLLEAKGLRHVDYCSIDVEGAERAILQGFPFKDYDISVFSVENALSGDAGSVRDILVPQGYRLVSVVGSDEIYAKNALLPAP